MKTLENSRLAGVLILLMAGLVACGKTWDVAERTANPDKFLEHLVSTKAVVIGTQPSNNVQNEITFSNGNMQYGWAGAAPIISEPILRSVGYRRTGACVYINNAPIIPGQSYDKMISLCVTDRDFAYMGAAMKQGDLYIILDPGRGMPRIWPAHLK